MAGNGIAVASMAFMAKAPWEGGHAVVSARFQLPLGPQSGHDAAAMGFAAFGEDADAFVRFP
jgi:hypothetical protein